MTTSTEYVLAGPRRIEAATRRLHDLPPSWARVRILYCGICGSDLSKFDGRRAIAYPASIGHELLGVVEAVGAEVTEVQVGDVVTSDLNLRCGQCAPCRRGQSHLCEHGQHSLFTNRAFAEYADMCASYLLPVDGAAHKHLALAEPLSCVLYALGWLAPEASQRVLVVGAGGLGLCAAFTLGAGTRPVPFEMTDLIGARARVLADASRVGQAVATVEPHGFDAVLDVSGSVSGLHLACRAVRAGGRLCTMSHLDGYGPTPFLLPELTRRDVQFKVSYLNGEPRNLRTAAAMLGARWNDSWDAAITTAPLVELQSAFELARKADTCKSIVTVA
jgi:threonine dehydrogenase-like Zn-dependent dehydrogenase